MIMLLEIAELVPLIQAMAAEYEEEKDLPRRQRIPESIFIDANQLIENFFGLDNHPDVSDTNYYLLEATGFSLEGIRIKDAIDRLIRAFYPNGVMVSFKVCNEYGTVAIHFNTGLSSHARHYS